MKRRRGNVIVLALALGLSPVLVVPAAPAHAQAQEAADTRLDRVRANLPADAVERIEGQIEAARAGGLPVGPLLDKAVEGIAKGVPPQMIAGAVAQLGSELGRARDLLGNGVPPDATDVAAVADALRRGVPEQAVRQVAQRAGPEEPVALAIHTVGDLMDQGVPVDQALAALEAWRGRGASSEELRELPAAVERLIRMGVLPSQAAAAVMGSMRAGHPPGPGGQPGAQGMGGPPPGGPPIPPGAGPPDDRGQERGQGKGKPSGGGPPGGG